jgi:hypothetical protein
MMQSLSLHRVILPSFLAFCDKLTHLRALTSFEFSHTRITDLEAGSLCLAIGCLKSLKHLTLWSNYTRWHPVDPMYEDLDLPIVAPADSLLPDQSFKQLTALTSLTLVRRWAHPVVAAKLVAQLACLLKLDLRSAFQYPEDKGPDTAAGDEQLCRCVLFIRWMKLSALCL